MKPRFKPPNIGSRYDLPGLDASGLIVDYYEDVPLSYFFPFRIQNCPAEQVLPENAILILLHTYAPCFTDGSIKQAVQLADFKKEAWPHPTWVTSTKSGFGRCHADLKMTFDGPWHTGRAMLIEDEGMLGFTSDHGIAGMNVVLIKMQRILESGSVSAGRTYILKDPLPDGGGLFTNYCWQTLGHGPVP